MNFSKKDPYSCFRVDAPPASTFLFSIDYWKLHTLPSNVSITEESVLFAALVNENEIHERDGFEVSFPIKLRLSNLENFHFLQGTV